MSSLPQTVVVIRTADRVEVIDLAKHTAAVWHNYQEIEVVQHAVVGVPLTARQLDDAMDDLHRRYLVLEAGGTNGTT